MAQALVVDAEMFGRIYAHAIARYTEGWDFIVECWEMKDVQKVADEKGITDYDALLADLAKYVEVFNEFAEDIRNA
jgi:hypothetical protein